MSNDYLYPELDPYDYGRLEVEAPHRLYFEQCGNRHGIPVVFLHGGPGSGCSPAHRRFFDPKHYRIILFDQRGAGRSTPAGCLDSNNTQALVDDLEGLRMHLDIDRWLLYGGSWGTTLALLYAQQYTQSVAGLVLRGIFLARLRDVEWVYGQQGVARLFPREYESFINHLAPQERVDPVGGYYRLFMQDEPTIRALATRQWHDWEARVVRQFLPPAADSGSLELKDMLRRAAIVGHYAHHGFFLGHDGVPLRFDQLRAKPCIIVHGQRDLVCPLEAAWTLHHAWSQSELRVVTQGGHVAAEPSIGKALVTAFDDMAGRLVQHGNSQ
jgi:proline iminopeptidase